MNAKSGKVRVGHLVDCFGSGGIATGVLTLVQATEGLVDHAVISLKDDFRLLERLGRRPTTHVIEPGPTKLAGFSLRLARVVRRYRIDVLHVNNPFAWLDASLVARATGRRCLQTFHGVERPVSELDGVERWKCRLATRLGSCVTAVGQASRRMVCELSGVSEADVEVIANGVDLERFRPAGGPSDPRRAAWRRELGVEPGTDLIVHAAGLRPVKDQETLLRAWRRLSERRDRGGPAPLLLIVGEGDRREDLEVLAGELGIAGTVRFLGQRRDLDQLLPAGDVFVLSSISEGLSFAILEAMACGLPVLATRVGGNAELVEDGATGLLVPPRDPEALAAALARLLGQAETRHAMGSRARAVVAQRHDASRAVRRYVELYQKLAHRPLARDPGRRS